MKPLKENSASTFAMMAVLKTRLPKRLMSSRGAGRFRAPAVPCAGLTCAGLIWAGLIWAGLIWAGLVWAGPANTGSPGSRCRW